MASARRRASPWRVRVVSDLHVGSAFGIWPPGFRHEGEEYPQNEYNAWLWQCWADMVARDPTDLLVVNGDLFEGAQPRVGGLGVKSVDPEVEQQAAIAVLAPAVAKAKAWMLVRGTFYHERAWVAVARTLGATPFPNGEWTGHVLDVRVRGVGVNFAHHPESGAVLYRGTMLDKTGLWATIAGALGKTHDARVIVRSHHHTFGVLMANGRTVVATPAWQLQTPYAKKLGYYRLQPDIGFVDIEVRDDERYPIVIPVLYDIPVGKALEVS